MEPSVTDASSIWLVVVFAVFAMVSASMATNNGSSDSSYARLELSNGSSICALGSPSLVLRLQDLDLPVINITPPSESTLCAWKCQREPNCICFNWKSCSNYCEFFAYVPTKCTIQHGCIHYTVRLCLISSSPSDTRITAFR